LISGPVGIASTAALFGRSAMVFVGPPLSFKPPESSPAGVFDRSPVPVKKAHVESSARLCPSEKKTPAQFDAKVDTLFAKSEFFN
jgi:hypothetical protein